MESLIKIKTLFEQIEKNLDALKKSIVEPDPICDCYANGPDDCWQWDSCKQRVEYLR